MTNEYCQRIRESGLTIYDPIEVGSNLWVPSTDLESILATGLSGFDASGLALRTRSKVVKEEVCRVLGYPVPKSFKKEQPRFPGQNFDTYIQSRDNLQIWNESISPIRRYVLIRPASDGKIKTVRVVNGTDLAILDRTGTLTQKYQARAEAGTDSLELVSAVDTENLCTLVSETMDLSDRSPVSFPKDSVLSIASLFSALSPLVGMEFEDAGIDQERNRGAKIHEHACRALGYMSYADDGRFPDIRNQHLEIKLQTSPTIDLGLVTPDSTELLDMPKVKGVKLRHCDVRYAIFMGETDSKTVKITNLILTTGENFFSRFTQFGGKVLNKKLQIPLPKDFF